MVKHRNSENYNTLQKEVKSRRDVENKLRQSNVLLAKTFYSMHDGLLLTNRQGSEIKKCNEAACKLLGYHETELLDMSLEDIQDTQKQAMAEKIANSEHSF